MEIAGWGTLVPRDSLRLCSNEPKYFILPILAPTPNILLIFYLFIYLFLAGTMFPCYSWLGAFTSRELWFIDRLFIIFMINTGQSNWGTFYFKWNTTSEGRLVIIYGGWKENTLDTKKIFTFFQNKTFFNPITGRPPLNLFCDTRSHTNCFHCLNSSKYTFNNFLWLKC